MPTPAWRIISACSARPATRIWCSWRSRPCCCRPACRAPRPSSSRRTAAAAEFQSLLLSNLQSLVCGPALDLHGVQDSDHLIEARIARWFNNIQLRSQRFAQLSQEKQHRLRNRIKSLRYCLEFLQGADDEGLHKVLRECQALIGAVTDVDVALHWYARHAVSPEQAQFARRWLTQARETRAAQAQRALNALGQHRPQPRLARH
ncbi:MAG: CHAD domain-containing protein [Alcaligenes sp.]